MKKVIPALCFCVFAFLGITASATTLDVVNGYMEMMQFYDVMEVKSAPTSANDAGTEIINGGSGNLIYEVTDLKLPGKGGLDLEVKRRFNTHENTDKHGNAERLYVENEAYGTEASVTTYSYVARYYPNGDTSAEPVFVMFDSVSHMLEAENGTNILHTGADYTDFSKLAFNKTTPSGNTILFSYTIEENTIGFAYGSKFYVYDELPQGNDVTLCRDLTAVPAKVTNKCLAIYDYYKSGARAGLPTGTPWIIDAPTMSLRTYARELLSDGFCCEGYGLFYDSETGKSLNYKIGYNQYNDDTYDVWELKLFSASEGGSMHEEDVLTSTMYAPVLTRQKTKDRLTVQIARSDGIIYTMRQSGQSKLDIIQKQDSFGNTIQYSNGLYDTTITDTYGRKVHISETGITINGQPYLIFSGVTSNNDVVDPNGLIEEDNVYRFTVKKAGLDGNEVTYGMRFAEDAYTVGKGSYAPYMQKALADVNLLDYVELGTGGRTEYSYIRQRDPLAGHSDGQIKRDFRKVAVRGRRINSTDTELKERIAYSYVTEGQTGKSLTRSVTKTYPDKAGYSEYEFYNNKGNMTLSEVCSTEQGNRYYIKTEKDYRYQAEGNYLPIKVTVTTKESKESEPFNKVVTKNIYNGRNQLVAEETRDDEVISINSYTSFGTLLEQFKKQSDGTWVGVVNTADRTKITSSKAAKKSTPDGAPQTFEETVYSYNANGDLVQMTKEGVTTNYSYTYADKNAFEANPYANALVRTATVKNVSNVANTDGTGSTTCDITVTEQYNWLGLLAKTTDARGGETTNMYDIAGRPIKTVYPDNRTAELAYNDASNEIITTAEDGLKQKLTYDALGRNTAGFVYDTVSQTWHKLYQNSYDNMGRLSGKSVYNDDGGEKSKIAYTYYDDGQTKSETVLEGESVLSKKEFEYNPYKSPDMSDTYVKVYTGSDTFLGARRTVDKYGRQVSDTIYEGSAVYTQSYTTDTLGNVLTVKDFNANAGGMNKPTVSYIYDYANRKVRETTAAGITLTHIDSLGRVEYEQDANGNRVYYTYNGAGKVIKTAYSVDETTEGETVNYYDVSGNMVREETKQSDGVYRSTRYIYDGRGRLNAAVVSSQDGDLISKYEYDAGGRVIKQANGLSGVNETINPEIHAVTISSYDRFGRLSTVTDPMGQTSTYSYNLLGELMSETDRGGITKTYSYDGLGNIKELIASKEGSLSETVSYVYNLMGNLTKMVDNNGETTYTYSGRGLLISEARGGITKYYSYDANGNRKSMTSTGINVSYSYDSLNRITGMTDGGTVTNYTYDANGNLLSESTDGSRNVTYTYNKINALTGKVNKDGENVLDTYSLDYYADGNIKSVTANGSRTDYAYDRAGRLTQETGKDGILRYSYDVYGNRTDMERLSPSGAVTEQSMYSYDKNNRLLDILTTEYNGAVHHTQYTYDANGNRTMQVQSGTTPAPMYRGASVRAGETGTGLTTYSYDLLGRMTGMQNDSATASYTYDGNGLRQSKNVNGRTTAYVYDGVNIIKEGDTYYSRGVSGLISANGNYYYTDYHGSVVRYGDSVYSYDAFGNQKTENTSDSNPFRYCGEYADSESGLVYLRARYYDSVIGAFVSEDPAKDGLNWYVYCSNNPVNLIDPLGEDAILITDSANVCTMGHTSALFQDGKGIWYYFYWGDKESFVQEITDSNAMKSLNALNNWLHDNKKWDGKAVYDGEYNRATYVAGDFTKSLKHAIAIAQNYSPDQYNFLTRNCFQTSWESLLKGKFWDGSSVASVAGGQKVASQPNSNLRMVENTFFNADFTYEKYWKTINDKLWSARQEAKNAKYSWQRNQAFWKNYITEKGDCMGMDLDISRKLQILCFFAAVCVSVTLLLFTRGLQRRKWLIWAFYITLMSIIVFAFIYALLWNDLIFLGIAMNTIFFMAYTTLFIHVFLIFRNCK